VYAWFNALPECNPHSHRPSATKCKGGDCHLGAICDPGEATGRKGGEGGRAGVAMAHRATSGMTGRTRRWQRVGQHSPIPLPHPWQRLHAMESFADPSPPPPSPLLGAVEHMDATFPGMQPYLASLWDRVFGHPLPPLPPSSSEQYLWSSRFLMRTPTFVRVARALRLLAAAALADVVSHPSGEPRCPFANRPLFYMPGANFTDPNPPRCVAMALERLLNYVLVGRGAQVAMVAPRAEFGDWGGPLDLRPPPLESGRLARPRRGVDADLPPYLQAMYPEVWGSPGTGTATAGGGVFGWGVREPPPAPYLLEL
jgi:hypothetical protein